MRNFWLLSLFVLSCWPRGLPRCAAAPPTRGARLAATVRRLSPPGDSLDPHGREAEVLSLISFLERSSIGREPQDKANPDSWSMGLGKPFTGKNGVQAGGGEEPEFNYDMNTASALPNGASKSCNTQTGAFLKGCVYRSDTHLRRRKMDACKADLSHLAASCVFGPVKE